MVYSEATNIVTERTIAEFLALNRVPRPTYHNEKVIAYLQDFAGLHGLAHFRDAYGNVWIDVPAAPGYEALPKVILQAHSDMVCVSVPEKQVDFVNEPIVPVIGEKTITAQGTTLGADDGIGLAMALAIATSDIPRGALRLLITSDEEGDLDGARELDPAALDSDYLINIDSENVEEICCSSAGYCDFTLSRSYDVTDLTSGERLYELSVGHLLGGHSGDDINKGRLHALVALREVLAAWSAAGLAYRLAEIDTGVAINVIAQSGRVVLALDGEASSLAQQLTARAFEELQRRYPQERMEWKLVEATGESALTAEASAALLAALAKLPQGVMAMSDKMENMVRTSSNIGIVRLQAGQVAIKCSSRSCVSEDLREIEASQRALAAELGFAFTGDGKGPGWDGDPESPLVRLMKKAYVEATQVEAKVTATHGALECGWFTPKRPSMQIVSVGPSLQNVHTTGETLFLDTVAPTAARVLYCLEHIGASEA